GGPLLLPGAPGLGGGRVPAGPRPVPGTPRLPPEPDPGLPALGDGVGHPGVPVAGGVQRGPPPVPGAAQAPLPGQPLPRPGGDGRGCRDPLLVPGGRRRRVGPPAGGGAADGGSRLELRALPPSGTAETLIEVPADDPLEGARQLGRAQLPFRPKAIPMTLFVRLVVADLFIHGTGGARYETIGDFLMAARW